MKPTNEEIIAKYVEKQKKLKQLVLEVQSLYSTISVESSKIEDLVMLQGCKIILHNSNNQLNHINNIVKNLQKCKN